MKISKVTQKDIEEIKADSRKFTKFLNVNKNFVNKIVHRVNRNKTKDYDYFLDSFQEGTIGLWNAVLKYDEKHASFSTFAYTCIKNQVLQKVKEVDNKTKFDVSIEKFRQNEEESTCEYYENKFINKKRNEFDFIDSEIDKNLLVSKLNEMDSNIFNFRIVEGKTLQETATAMKMKFPTFKLYYYKVFIPKMKKLSN